MKLPPYFSDFTFSHVIALRQRYYITKEAEIRIYKTWESFQHILAPKRPVSTKLITQSWSKEVFCYLLSRSNTQRQYTTKKKDKRGLVHVKATFWNTPWASWSTSIRWQPKMSYWGNIWGSSRHGRKVKQRKCYGRRRPCNINRQLRWLTLGNPNSGWKGLDWKTAPRHW